LLPILNQKVIEYIFQKMRNCISSWLYYPRPFSLPSRDQPDCISQCTFQGSLLKGVWSSARKRKKNREKSGPYQHPVITHHVLPEFAQKNDVWKWKSRQKYFI